MSRFFTAESSESESEDSEVEEIQRPKASAPTSRVFQFSDDEDDQKRVVRSAKDKRFEVLQTAIKNMRNSMKIHDIAKVLTEYENLTKGYEKAKTVVEKEGIPNFYIKILSDLEDYIQTQWEDTDGRKKLSKLNAKALATLRQKLKKYNRDFETQIKDCKANPSKYEEVEEAEEEEEDEEDGFKGSDGESDDEFVPKSQSKPVKDFDDYDSDSDFGFDDDDDSDSSDDETPAILAGGLRELTAAYFLKTDKSKEKEEKKKSKRAEKKERPKAERKEKEQWTEVRAGGVHRMRGKITFPKDTEINHQAIMKKFHEILAVRGKKGTDRTEQIEYFTELRKISLEHKLGPAMNLKMLFNITSAIFDSSTGTDVPLKPDMWERLLETIQEIYYVFEDYPDIQFGEFVVEENLEDASKGYRVQEDPVTLLERMDAEFIKILQGCDGHSTEYIQKLKDEMKVVALIDQLLDFLETNTFPSDLLCRVYLARIEHIYYRLDMRDLRNIRDQIKESEDKRIVSDDKEEEVKVEETKVEETKPEETKPEAEQPLEAALEEPSQADAEPAEGEVAEATEGEVAEGESAEEVKVEVDEAKVEGDEAIEVESAEAEAPTEAEVPAEASTEPTAPEKTPEEIEEELRIKARERRERKREQDDTALLNRLCKFIYTKGEDSRIRTRAMLCQIYHHALHDRWYQARDLMLISHLQEAIQHSDIPTQILYNRTMVQIGLCAFRHGMITDAHNSLHDIQATGRPKEMLAQGLMNLKNTERTPEQEKIEKRRMMPFHMHINLELLECVYLTSAMLLEIPHMASHEYDVRRRIISKSFHYQLRVSDRQPLVGPPESMREHIVAASKAMKSGDWKLCKKYILAVSCWDLFPKATETKEMLAKKIQEESLRTYLFTYNKVYDSISLHSLAEMFELPAAVVHSTISKMIINEELQASWDEPSATLILHHGAEPTYLQSLNLQLSDKINGLVEHHERILNFKYGRDFLRNPLGFNHDFRGGGRGRGRGRGGRGGNRNDNQGRYQDRDRDRR